MTIEQDAERWQTLKQYKNLRAERDQREAIAKNWGNAMVSVGEPLASCGALIARVDLSKLPDKPEMMESQKELKFLYDQIAGLAKILREAGMGEFLG